MKDILSPLKSVKFIHRNNLKPNDYNPNKVLEQNLKLLVESILSNGWTMPIVCRPDMTIIDGFHRWMVSGREPLLSKLQGIVPVVIVEHKDETGNMYGTITHNRARGTHLLEPMEKIIRKLLDSGKEVKEISKQLGRVLYSTTSEWYLATFNSSFTFSNKGSFFNLILERLP